MSFNVVSRARPLIRYSKFIDSVQVKFQGGTGGDGCISMLSVFCNEFAGPDGGNGGNGGHVVLKASQQIKSLNHLNHFYRGLPGERGKGKNLFGANAPHTIVEVPVGTVVTEGKSKELADHEFDPEQSDTIAELDEDCSLFIAARGGSGGRGNASYLSNLNRHPRIAEAGALGEVNTYLIRLRRFAHVGLIGLPNVGKSTLLATLTNAKVKIGNYAFTTTHPQVGTIDFEDFTKLAISDLPGLIEESHKNRGLGVQFLRSVKKCACLLYVIDLTDEPIRQLETLIHELESFKKGLSSRPNIVFANKIDDPKAHSNLDSLRNYVNKNLPGSKIIVGSSLRGDNLEQLRLELRILRDISGDDLN